MTRERIVEVCETFIKDLDAGKALDRADIFPLLEEAARERGYTIAAKQRGIHGTYLSFVAVQS